MMVALDASTPQEHKALDVSTRFTAVTVTSIPPTADMADGKTDNNVTSGTNTKRMNSETGEKFWPSNESCKKTLKNSAPMLGGVVHRKIRSVTIAETI